MPQSRTRNVPSGFVRERRLSRLSLRCAVVGRQSRTPAAPLLNRNSFDSRALTVGSKDSCNQLHEEPVLKREFHPEWGYVAADRRSIRTLRAILIATTVGAVAGGAIVLLVSGTPEDSRSVATRSLVPPEVEVIARTSAETFGELPLTEQRPGLPLAAPAQSNVKTGGTTEERGPATPERSSLVASVAPQGHASSLGGHDIPAHSGDLNLSTRGASDRDAPRRPDHAKPAQATSQPPIKHEPLPRIPQTREAIVKQYAQRDARNGDLSPFFRPWW